MAQNYFPTADQPFLSWAQNASGHIISDAAAYDVDPDVAAELVAATQAYADALAAALDPTRRTPAVIHTKDEKKDDLMQLIRRVMRQVQGSMRVTDARRVELGLPIHKTEPTRHARPTTMAKVVVESVEGNMLKIRLQDSADPSRRSRPEDVEGATVFSFVGEQPSPNPEDWTFMGSTGRMTFTVAMPAELPPATKVWLTAMWWNSRKESGPASPAVSAVLMGGLPMAA